ncbi:unnamed protein product [Haemonchus placei]|uniref:G protein-coupled receptor n=1 Tax=Haemonchus placei TaxID=6290 RepID=A0A0N4W3R3_HAEPC|nr:unnamed protein product [Haemonchus placei]
MVTGFYLVFMYLLSAVAVPLNLLSLYCILTKSPAQMAAYKWYLLIYQTISTVFDTVYLVLTLPIIFFPIPMGYPASWTIPWIPITTHLAVLLVVYIATLFGATIVSLFMYRCHVITPARHFSKISHQGMSWIPVSLRVNLIGTSSSANYLQVSRKFPLRNAGLYDSPGLILRNEEPDTQLSRVAPMLEMERLTFDVYRTFKFSRAPTIRHSYLLYLYKTNIQRSYITVSCSNYSSKTLRLLIDGGTQRFLGISSLGFFSVISQEQQQWCVLKRRLSSPVWTTSSDP